MIFAIAMRSGRLKHAITRYKYGGRYGWATIFGRVLVGYLEAGRRTFDAYDVIIPMPTYVGPDGRDFDHIGLIIERAAQEGPDWPFRLDVMRKTRATPRLADQQTFIGRARVAEEQIGPALEVVRPDVVRGASVLVFDDVFTGGLTLREAARKLLAAGAERVDGVVLARQPFRA